MSDRDTTFKIQLKHLDDLTFGPGSFYILGQTFDHKDFPEKEGVVRMYQYINGLCWQSSDPTTGEPIINYTEISQIDMKGYFPSTILNLVLGTLMHSEHRKMFDYMRQSSRGRGGCEESSGGE